MLLLVGVELAAFRIIVFRHGGGDWASFATVHLPFSPEIHRSGDAYSCGGDVQDLSPVFSPSGAN